MGKNNVRSTISKGDVKDIKKKQRKEESARKNGMLVLQCKCNHRNEKGRSALEPLNTAEDEFITEVCDRCDRNVITDPSIFTKESIAQNIEIVLSYVDFIQFSVDLPKDAQKEFVDFQLNLHDLKKSVHDTFKETTSPKKGHNKNGKNNNHKGSKNHKGKGGNKWA
jgi:hypothetical protein